MPKRQPFTPKRGTCSVCGETDRPVHRNKKSGELVCLGCKPRRIGQCFVCGRKNRPVRLRRQSTRLICDTCNSNFYDRQPRKKQPCQYCHHRRFLKYWLKLDHQRLKVCLQCYRHYGPKEHCGLCSSLAAVAYRLSTTSVQGLAVCRSCYRNFIRQATCASCGEYKPVAKRWPPISFCAACLKNGQAREKFPALWTPIRQPD